MTASVLWARLQRPIILLAMQSCWMYAWMAVVERAATGHRVVAVATVLLFVAAATWRRTVSRFAPGRIRAEVLYWAALPVVAAIATKLALLPDSPLAGTGWLLALPRAFAYILYETRAAELLLALGAAAAWYLGRRFDNRSISYEQLLGQFQLGIVMLLTALLVGYGLESIVPRAGLLVVCFFAIALAGIASARSTEQKGAAQRPGHVTTSVVTLVFVVSGIGLLIGAIVTPGLIDTLVGAVRYVTHLVGEAIAYLASLLPQPEWTPAEPEASPGSDDSGLREFYKSIPLSAVLRRALFIVWTAIVLGMLAVAVWRICSILMQRLRRPGSSEERESIENGLLADLLAVLIWLQSRASMLVRRLKGLLSSQFGLHEPATARTIYLRFSRWAGKKVARREPWQSPHEYLEVLSGLIPDARPDLAYITESYAQVRYGGHELAPDAIEHMTQATKRIRKARRVDPTRTHKEGLQ